ncbi:MAG TPA: spore germination protein GerW family protein [Polyangiaceae bacterium]|jgi:uncharacterized spore protein YtfJ
MSDDLSDLVRQMLDGMHTLSKTDTIFGEPIQAQHATLIPVHRLRIGFAAGTARGDANAAARRGQSGGQGVTGSVQLDPIAVITVGADKVPRILAVDGDAESTLARLADQIPELIARAAKGLSERVVAPVLAGADDDEKKLPEGERGPRRRQ